MKDNVDLSATQEEKARLRLQKLEEEVALKKHQEKSKRQRDMEALDKNLIKACSTIGDLEKGKMGT